MGTNKKRLRIEIAGEFLNELIAASLSGAGGVILGIIVSHFLKYYGKLKVEVIDLSIKKVSRRNGGTYTDTEKLTEAENLRVTLKIRINKTSNINRSIEDFQILVFSQNKRLKSIALADGEKSYQPRGMLYVDLEYQNIPPVSLKILKGVISLPIDKNAIPDNLYLQYKTNKLRK